MRFGEMFKLAMRNIAGNKMRTFLTMLGIIIGVAAVMLIAGLGNGMKNYMRNMFKDSGSDQITVSLTGKSTRTLSVDDMFRLVDEHPEDFRFVTPQVSVMGTVRIGKNSLEYSDTVGVSEDFAPVFGTKLVRGRSLSYMDMKERAAVCVVGQYLNQNFFDGDALGKTLRINGAELTVIGVLDYMSNPEEATGEFGEWGRDNVIYLPYTAASRLGSGGTVDTYRIKIVNEMNLTRSQQVAQDYLRDIFKDTKSFRISNNSNLIQELDKTTNIVVGVLLVIAGISLLVGGIGIMNIMLVSVTERTREIGIRKALGAKQRAILGQFVLESATTSGIGGLFGIALGFLLCLIGNYVATFMMNQNLNVAPSLGSTLISFAISAGIGILFGFLPARKAAKLNPIDALRYE